MIFCGRKTVVLSKLENGEGIFNLRMERIYFLLLKSILSFMSGKILVFRKISNVQHVYQFKP